MSRSAAPHSPMSKHTTTGRHVYRATAAAAAAGLVAGLVLSAPVANAAAAERPVARSASAVTPTRSLDISAMQGKLDRLVEKGAPGAVLYTYDNGQVTALASGLADLDAGTPMTADTSFRIGSLTKTYVSTAVLKLVAKHRLDLAAPSVATCPV